MRRRTFLQILSGLGGTLLLPRRAISALTASGSRSVAAGTERGGREPVGVRPRVLNMHAAQVASWDYAGGNYLAGIDAAVVRRMLDTGLQALTDTRSAAQAWGVLLKNYRPGDRIVIKPNFNNTRIGYGEAIMTSPQLVAAVVASLLEAGYPLADLTVYDLTAGPNADIDVGLAPLGVRTVFGQFDGGFIDRLLTRLEWGDGAADRQAGIAMQRPVRDEAGREIACFLPKVCTGAAHLINLPVLKGHQFLLLSGPLKNHFGTVRFGNRYSHPVLLHGAGLPQHLVDLNSHPQIRSKTRLIVADAIFGAGCFTRGGRGRGPEPWTTLRQGQTPGCLILGTDPVAVESVLGDMVAKEQCAQGFEPFAHDYLHVAERAGLGIHDHADAFGSYRRIDYRQQELSGGGA